MKKNWLGIAGGAVLLIVVLWFLTGGEFNCHESFWDKDKQVIEIKHD